MSSDQKIKASLQVLRKVAVKSKPKKSILESVDNVSSSVVLLNSSSPSSLTFDKLVSVLRAPFVPLYSVFTEAALNVTSAILEVVLNNVLHFTSKDDNRNAELQVGWERVAHSVLSGVIDYLESNDNVKTKSSIAKAFYSTLCGFFFGPASDNLGDIGVILRCTAYMVLSDTATLHHENQSKLREDKVLGAPAIGKAISMTRDFAALEALLNLFAILLPSSSVPQKRGSYIRDVFCHHGEEIVAFLDTMSTKEWDEAAAKVVDILATSDISFPQPFDVDEVTVCHNRYPQPEASDRFYVDRMCFFVNVRQDDGLYEDLQIKFNIVTGVKISSAGEKTTPVSVTLSSIPKLGDQEVNVQNGPPVLRVAILNGDIPRLREALRYRNLDSIIGRNKKPRISVSATLDLDEYRLQGGNTSPVLSQKIQNVEAFYSLHSDQSETARADGNGSRSRAIASGDTAEIQSKPESKDVNPEDIQEVPTKLNPSICGTTDEGLSDIEKTSDAHANARHIGPSVGESTKLPADIVVPSGDEAKAQLRSVSSVRKGTKKRLPRLTNSNVENGKDELKVKAPQRSKNCDAPKDDMSKNATSTADGKSAAAGGTASSGRPRRTAAATASAKLAKTFADGSEDTTKGAAEKKLATELPLDETHDSSDSSTEADAPTINQDTKGRRVAKANSRSTRTLEPVDLRSSSPTSKISKMKAKTTGTKSTCSKAQKRTIDKASGVDEEASARKKQRTTRAKDKSKKGSPDTAAEHETRTSNHGLLETDWQESDNWDAVPSGAKAKPQENLPVTPVKQNVSGKSTAKKENTKRATKNPERKQFGRKRVPLQAISTAENRVSKANENDVSLERTPTKAMVSKKAANHSANVGTEPNEKKSSLVLPSLEEVLLRGATVDNLEVPEKAAKVIEIADDDNEGPPNFETEAEDVAPVVIDLDDEPDVHEVAKEKPDTEMVLLEEPRTPTPSKPIESTPVRKLPEEIPEERQLKKALDLDPDIFDLTNEDIKEVLQTLRERKSKKERNLGTACQPEAPKIKTLQAEDRDSSDVENNKSVLPRESLRPKVTFDVKPRYKSVSLENKPAEDVDDPRIPGLISRKHRLSDIKPMPIESTTRKRQEQPKKDPGMQDIINVLDAIQNVIVSNISDKSRAVRSDVRTARDRLIREAANDLCEMREESVGHYNKLLFLENEYASVNRKLNEGMENAANINADLCKFVRQTIATHDRGTVSKKLPQTLLASGLPASFQKFA